MLYFRFISGLGMAIVFGLVLCVAFVCVLQGDITGVQLLLITCCCVFGVALSVELAVDAYETLEGIERGHKNE